MSELETILGAAKVGTARVSTTVALPVNAPYYLPDTSPEMVWAVAAHVMAADPSIHTGENANDNVGIYLTSRNASINARQGSRSRARRSEGPAKTVHFYRNQAGFTGRTAWDKVAIVTQDQLTPKDIARGKLLAIQAGQLAAPDEAEMAELYKAAK